MTELSHQRRLLVVAVCSLSLFIVGIDNTIVNVALPAIQHDLHAPVSGLQWTVDAYILVIASFLMLSGSVADRFGRRRIFQTGLAVFTLGSLLCSLAPGLGWLVAFRMVQALGGSMMNPVALSIITNIVLDPRERARALGIWGGVFGVSMALGPVVGGALVAGVGWRGIFWSTFRSAWRRSCSPRCSCRNRARLTRGDWTRSARCWSSRCWRPSPARSSRAPASAGDQRRSWPFSPCRRPPSRG